MLSCDFAQLDSAFAVFDKTMSHIERGRQHRRRPVLCGVNPPPERVDRLVEHLPAIDESVVGRPMAVLTEGRQVPHVRGPSLPSRDDVMDDEFRRGAAPHAGGVVPIQHPLSECWANSGGPLFLRPGLLSNPCVRVVLEPSSIPNTTADDFGDEPCGDIILERSEERPDLCLVVGVVRERPGQELSIELDALGPGSIRC